MNAKNASSIRKVAKGCVIIVWTLGFVGFCFVGFFLLVLSKDIPASTQPPKPTGVALPGGPTPTPPVVEGPPPAHKYTLTVNGGSGSGTYLEGERVFISANPAPVDQIFLEWTSADNTAFFGRASDSATFIGMPNHSVIVTANHQPVDRLFSGQCVSDTGKTKYELSPIEKRFSFYTLIEGRFLLQTDIFSYNVQRIDDAGRIIEISGEDRQAGGAPSAKFKLTQSSDDTFKLERREPVSGNLGDFHRQP